MSNDQRGAYTPQSEAPLSFDARRANGPDERPRSNMLIISAAVLAVLIAAFVIFTLTRVGGGGTEEETPTFEAMKAPVEQVTTLDPNAGMTVEPVETLNPNFAPLPESPEARPEPGATVIPPPAVAQTPPAPVAAPIAKAPAAPPAQVASAAPAAPRAISGAVVQIGAFSSSSLAEREWNQVALDDPAAMSGKTRRVEPVEADGQTRFRSLIGGFASRAEADAFCERLKTRGRTCFARN